ncbi:MAG TPA: hypothetical protein VK095_13530 [Beutenbergiaceae bacterium]|nr:hypothetical protein [Beutenbergiaceae bacterium]
MRAVGARWRRLRDRDEDGQIMLLSMVYGLVALALVMVIVSVSAVYLERKRLLSLADALAADAADAADLQVWYGAGETDLVLTDASVRTSVDDYLGAAPAAVTGRFEDFAVTTPTGTPDGETAQVSLTAQVRPPLVPWMLTPWQDGFPIEVTAEGRADEP